MGNTSQGTNLNTENNSNQNSSINQTEVNTCTLHLCLYPNCRSLETGGRYQVVAGLIDWSFIAEIYYRGSHSLHVD
jgi:hypothetical protein